MAQIFSLDDTDSRIDYRPERSWTAVNDSREAWNPDGTYHYASSQKSQFYFLFRGTGISLFGRKGPGGGILRLIFDGKTTRVDLTSNDPAISSTLIWSETGLGDTDHQLFAETTGADANVQGVDVADIWVDYFKLENAAGTGFDPIWAGTNATNVPKEAKIVDSADPKIQWSGNWDASSNARFYSPSSRHTRQNGASMTYTFEGVAVWYYADLDKAHGYYTVTLDDDPPVRLNGLNAVGQITRQMKWSKRDLFPGQHTFTLTHNDTNGRYATFDYLRILSSEVPLTFDPSTITDQAPISTLDSQSSSNTDSRFLALAVGLPVAFIVVACAVLFLVLHRRKQRNRMSLDLVQTTTHRGSLLPYVMPRSFPADRKGARRVPAPLPPAPESTAPPPYTEPSPTESSGFPEVVTMSISLPNTSQQHLQDNGVNAPPIPRQ